MHGLRLSYTERSIQSFMRGMETNPINFVSDIYLYRVASTYRTTRVVCIFKKNSS